MAKPKSKCHFNEKLREKYPYLEATKIDTSVHCKKCRGVFSIASGGVNDIERHLNTKKHRQAAQAASTSASIQGYFPKDDDLNLSAQEGVWAFHLLKDNLSFRSSDCASKIFKYCFDMKQFACARTKCEAIITNVFAPHSDKMGMFSWALLKQTPKWDAVNAVMTALHAKKIYDAEKNASNLHTQFGFVKNYCSSQKIMEWNEKKIPMADRWVEIFQNLNAVDCDFCEIATIIEYILFAGVDCSC